MGKGSVSNVGGESGWWKGNSGVNVGQVCVGYKMNERYDVIDVSAMCEGCMEDVGVRGGAAMCDGISWRFAGNVCGMHAV